MYYLCMTRTNECSTRDKITLLRKLSAFCITVIIQTHTAQLLFKIPLGYGHYSILEMEKLRLKVMTEPILSILP